MGTELRGLFKRSQCTGPSTSNNESSGSESLLARAGRLCQQLRPGKKFHYRKNAYKPYKRPLKEVQKGLVLIDYQGKDAESVPFREYHKLYDGCIQYHSDMAEDDIRQEKRLVRMKKSETHTLNCLMPDDFDFVRCANRRVKPIDGDAAFDGNWISNVYKNGSVYVRLNTTLLEKSSVGSFSCFLMLIYSISL